MSLKTLKNNVHLVQGLVTLIFLISFSSPGLSQNTVKAEIKKPQISIVGEWAVSIPNQGGIFEYVYDFLPNGNYRYLDVIVNFNPSSITGSGVAYRILETGKWKILNNDKRTLVLKSDSISNKRIQPFDIADSQEFFQTKSSAFIIRRKSGDEMKEYIYLRRNYNFRRSRFY